MADYQYFNIMDVDPSFTPLEDGVYELRINKLVGESYVPKSGKREGEATIRIKGDFAVVNHNKFSGRRLFHTFWLHSGFDQKALRRIADRTGIGQDPSETFEAWLGKLTQSQPTFKVKVEVVPDMDYTTKTPKVDEITGKPVMTNAINWKEVFCSNS